MVHVYVVYVVVVHWYVAVVVCIMWQCKGYMVGGGSSICLWHKSFVVVVVVILHGGM